MRLSGLWRWVCWVLLLPLTLGAIVGAAVFKTDSCESQGGHLVTHTNLAVGFSPTGEATVIPVTTTFCVSKDGRIVD